MRPRRWIMFACLAGAFAMIAATAMATPFTVGQLSQASGPSPFAGCTVGGPGTVFENAEVEPWVAVNPTDPTNLVAVFQQDRWSNGGAHGLVTATSHDGGASWATSFAPFSFCSGGTAANGGDLDRASDPWVTFTPTGDAYQISLSASADLTTSAMLVSKSIDGGDTWSAPTTLIRETSVLHFNDKESITADPTDPTGQTVYAVWDRSRHPSDNPSPNAFHSFAFRGDIIFTRTTDGGANWDAPQAIFEPNANLFTVGNQIAVLPDGTLIDVFNFLKGSGVQPSGKQTWTAVVRSTDGGDTWSAPNRIDRAVPVDVTDPDTGANVRAGEGLPEIGVDANTGQIYVAWDDGRFTDGAHNDIVVSTSTDGGESWSDPVKVNQTPEGFDAFTPSVEVAADGTVGVTYYDFRNNTPASGVPTDYFLVHSHDGGTTWGSEVRLTDASFDIETAPVARGFFLGDYEGLATIGNDFFPFFIQTNAGDASNPTDAFGRTAGP